MGYGDTFVHKPGMQSGPVAQGIADLVASDPDAYWDTSKNEVVSPLKGTSPRVPGDSAVRSGTTTTRELPADETPA